MALLDPNFGPNEVAAEAGISLRYLQKLFTEHGSTCSEFIYSLRLDQAARLLHRRGSLGQASLSAKSPTLAAFATTLISHESFAIGSVTRQVLTLKVPVGQTTKQCAPVRVKVRHMAPER